MFCEANIPCLEDTSALFSVVEKAVSCLDKILSHLFKVFLFCMN